MATTLGDAKVTLILDLDKAKKDLAALKAMRDGAVGPVGGAPAPSAPGQGAPGGSSGPPPAPGLPNVPKRRKPRARRDDDEEDDGDEPRGAGRGNRLLNAAANAAAILAILKAIRELGPYAAGAVRPSEPPAAYDIPGQARQLIADQIEELSKRLAEIEAGLGAAIQGGRAAIDNARLRQAIGLPPDPEESVRTFAIGAEVALAQARVEIAREVWGKEALGAAGRQVLVDGMKKALAAAAGGSDK